MRFPSRRSLALWLVGLASAAVLAGLGGLVVVEGGLYDVAASTPDPSAEAVIVHRAMIRSVQMRAAAIKAPPRFGAVQIEAGLRDYDASCAVCHGGPGIAQSAFAHGMTPAPPYILDAPRQWRARELYWIVAHGVKQTAMPAWESIRTDAEIWNIVAFLEAAPYLTPREYARIRTGRLAEHSSAPGSNARGT